ncbi:hypothetical protein FI667_g10591, partial [Globisporangium splendens]
MPPPRSLRVLEPSNDEPGSEEVLDAMHSYANAHQVNEMLQILLARLLETQPLDSFDFLIPMLAQKDAQLDAKARIQRFDLRREKTKKQLVVAFYTRLLALQRTQHSDKTEAYAPELSRAFLLAQLQLSETKAHLRERFPRHYRDLTQSFLSNAKTLKPRILLDEFTRHCMEVLATMASSR